MDHEHEHGHGDASDRGDTATPGVNDTIVGVSFDDRFRATEFLTAMGRLASRKELVLKDVVLVTKADDGTTRVEESTDPTTGRAALSGALWASLLGLILGGPVGWVAGGVVGAVGEELRACGRPLGEGGVERQRVVFDELINHSGRGTPCRVLFGLGLQK